MGSIVARIANDALKEIKLRSMAAEGRPCSKLEVLPIPFFFQARHFFILLLWSLVEDPPSSRI
jgi:hypothetical protein